MKIIGAFAPRRVVRTKEEPTCLREVHAEVFSVGGAVILAVCLVLTAATLMAAQSARVSELQRVVMVALTVGAWLYVLDSLSERLRLVDHSVEYKSFLGRRRLIPLEELEAMLFVYEGFNLERGIESIEFRRTNRAPERISLGPCWHQHKLEAFLRSVEQALQDPHLLEEVR